MQLCGVAVLALLVGSVLQMLILMSVLSEVPALAGENATVVGESLREAHVEALLLSLGIGVPLAAVVTVLATFRYAGPLHRFDLYLQALERGEDPGRLVLRRGDELQDIAGRLDSVTAPLRERNRDAARRAAAA